MHMDMSNNDDRRAAKRMYRRQFSMQTLLGLVACAACALVGFTAGQRYEHVQLSEGWKELNLETASRWKSVEKACARLRTIERQRNQSQELRKHEEKLRAELRRRGY